MLTLIVLALLAGAGYYFYKKFKTKVVAVETEVSTVVANTAAEVEDKVVKTVTTISGKYGGTNTKLP